MSLSDHLRYLRAINGGEHPNAIYEAIGVEKGIMTAETAYRPIRDEALIAKLADYYKRPLEEFEWHNARPRKFLTFYVAEAMRNNTPVELQLRSGQTLAGNVEWWDLSSIGLREENGCLLVVQRHAVVDWPNATDWEDV
ncbi:MAG: hypothetical protein R3C62_04575 [Chloroflexota bacterium]